jgi:hypothetical protein
VFECDESIAKDSFYLKKLVEHILLMVKDESALVSIAAKNAVSTIISKAEEPDLIISRLSANL